jgi:hypothetical protein
MNNLNYASKYLRGGSKLERNYIWRYANKKVEYHWCSAEARKLGVVSPLSHASS